MYYDFFVDYNYLHIGDIFYIYNYSEKKHGTIWMFRCVKKGFVTVLSLVDY